MKKCRNQSAKLQGFLFSVKAFWLRCFCGGFERPCVLSYCWDHVLNPSVSMSAISFLLLASQAICLILVLTGGPLEGWRSLPLSLCMLSQLPTREGPGRDTDSLVLLPKLGWIPPAGPPSLCPEPYSSHNEVCRVNSHSAGHGDEDSIPLMSPLSCRSQQGQGQGFSWLADTCVLAPFKKRRGGMQELVSFPLFERQRGFHCMDYQHLSPFQRDSSVHLPGPGCLKSPCNTKPVLPLSGFLIFQVSMVLSYFVMCLPFTPTPYFITMPQPDPAVCS